MKPRNDTFSLKDVGELLDCAPLQTEAAEVLREFRATPSGADPGLVTLVHIQLLLKQRRLQQGKRS